MAGVAIGLRDIRSPLSEWASQLRVAITTLEPTVVAIAKQELGEAVTEIKRISPVKTGRFRAGWKVIVQPGLRFAIATDPIDPRNGVHYASYVHRKGERGSPFWTTHAMPIVEDARQQINARVRVAMADMLRVQAAQRIAPSIPVARSLAARGRVRL